MSGDEIALYVLLAITLLGGGGAAARARAVSMRPPRLPKQKLMTKSELQTLAETVGFPDSNVAAAVALAESGGDPNAIGDDGRSIGLWQIFVLAHPQYSAEEMFDPIANARAAFEISQHGKNWRPWTTYRNGAYRKHL